MTDAPVSSKPPATTMRFPSLAEATSERGVGTGASVVQDTPSATGAGDELAPSSPVQAARSRASTGSRRRRLGVPIGSNLPGCSAA